MFDDDGGKDQGEKASEYTEIEIDEIHPPMSEPEVSDDRLLEFLQETEALAPDYEVYL